MTGELSVKSLITIRKKAHPRKLKDGRIINVKRSKPYKVPMYPRPLYITKIKVNGEERLAEVSFHKGKRRYRLLSDRRKGKRTSSILINRQIQSNDWSHLSIKYPNIMGLTDNEIDAFIRKEYNKINNDKKEYEKEGYTYLTDEDWTKRKKKIIEYIKHIKCYDQEEIKEISRKLYYEFQKEMADYEATHRIDLKNKYSKDSTIFITSPKGGFDILSDFAYANELKKKNFPYDLERSLERTLKSTSLPYSYDKIKDVNDIVFVDDIFMTGEQCNSAYDTLKKKIEAMKIRNNEFPRLHYMAIVGNEEAIMKHRLTIEKWNTFIVGEKYSFQSNEDINPDIKFKPNEFTYQDVSAVVFNFSIPDGERHALARKLYRSKSRFRHKIWTS